MRQSRLHRLPQRLDYTLIPAPLDLTLPLVDDKAELPAIIVTPASPICPTDFAIAFLAPPPKKPFWSRVSSFFSLPTSFNPRMALMLLFLSLIVAFHLVTHKLTALQPNLDFDLHTQQEYGGFTEGAVVTGSGTWVAGSRWLGLDKVLGNHLKNRTHHRDFVIMNRGH